MRELIPPVVTRILNVLVVLVCLFLVAPILVVLATSLTDKDYIIFPPGDLSLRWYQELFTDRAFMRSLLVSVEIAAASAVVSSIFGIAAAIGIVRYRFPGRAVIQAILLSPLVLPTLVIGVAMLQFFAASHIRSSIFTIMLGHFLITIPYVMRLTIASLQNFDRKIELAAMDLGATRISAFIRVTLPNIIPGILGGAMFALIISFEDVNLSLFLSSPGTTTLPVQIYNLITQDASPLASAGGSVLAIAIIVLAVIVERVMGLDSAMSEKSRES